MIGFDSAASFPSPSQLHRLGYRIVGANTILGFVVVEGPRSPTAFRGLAGLPDAAFVEENRLLRASFIPDDPLFAQQWGPSAIKAPAAWNRTFGTASVVIAVIDTGIDYGHPDLAHGLWSDASGSHGYDLINGDADPKDDHGHGTHVAGIAAARLANAVGIAGIAQASIMAIKVLDQDGYGPDSVVATGVQWAVDHGARIISMSLGDTQRNKALERAVNYAWAQGAITIAAAGNSYEGPVEYPARYSSVIAVSALDSDDSLASYSNIGGKIELAAPGTSILSTMPTYSVTLTGNGLATGYASLSGTSMAVPHVSGTAALVWSIQPALTNLEVREILTSTAVDLGAAGPDRYFGAGKVDAASAVQAASPLPVLQVALSTSLASVTSGGEATLVAEVSSGATPISGALVTMASSAGGAFGTVLDEGNGRYTVTYTAPDVLTAVTTVIRAVATLTGYLDGASQLPLQLLPLPPLVLSLSGDPLVLTSNRTALLTAIVTDGTGNLEGASVVGEVIGGAGTLTPFVPVAPGNYQALLTAPVVDATTALSVLVRADHPDFVAAERSLTFSVAPSPLTPAKIQSLQAGRSDVAVGETIELSFPYPMDPRSVEAAFALLDSEGMAIAGGIQWAEQNTILRFDPARALRPLSSYTIQISPGATDQWGDPLQEPYRATFATAESPPRAAFATWLLIGLAGLVIAGAALAAFSVLRGKGSR